MCSRGASLPGAITTTSLTNTLRRLGFNGKVLAQLGGRHCTLKSYAGSKVYIRTFKKMLQVKDLEKTKSKMQERNTHHMNSNVTTQ